MIEPMGKKNRVHVYREGGGRRRRVVFCFFNVFLSLSNWGTISDEEEIYRVLIVPISFRFIFCTQLHILENVDLGVPVRSFYVHRIIFPC